MNTRGQSRPFACQLFGLRFQARRGKCFDIRCLKGKSFYGQIKQFAASLRIFPPRFQRRQKIRAEAEPVFNNRKLISSLPSLGQPVSAQKNKTGLFISPVFGCINIAELGAVSTAPVVKRNFPLSNSHIDA